MMNRLIFSIAETAYRFIALNIFWFIFTVVGFGIFGFMPATVAVFRVVREWVKGNKDIPLFRSYLTFYKAEFISSNLLGAFFLVLFYIIYVNVSFVPYFYNPSIHLYIYIFIFSVTIIAVISFLNIFSIIAHFEHKKIVGYLKAAIGLVFIKPMLSLLQLIWLSAYILIAVNYPTVFIAIGMSVFAYVIMSFNYEIFRRYKTNVII